jgi:galactokinase/mevalonate kinase-like predicted kinase
MFENIFSNSASRSEKQKEVLLNYAEIAKNRKEIEERKRKEKNTQNLKNLGKEAEIQEGVEKARKTLEKEFEHRS